MFELWHEVAIWVPDVNQFVPNAAIIIMEQSCFGECGADGPSTSFADVIEQNLVTMRKCARKPNAGGKNCQGE